VPIVLSKDGLKGCHLVQGTTKVICVSSHTGVVFLNLVRFDVFAVQEAMFRVGRLRVCINQMAHRSHILHGRLRQQEFEIFAHLFIAPMQY